MTREEKEQVGKYVLQMARFLADGCYQQEMLLKAVHIIDEALEQEPCEDWHDVPSDEMTLKQARQAVKDLRKKSASYLRQEYYGDCVSREAVEEITWEEPSYKDALNVLAEVREKIRQLPPVAPQPNNVLDKIRAEIVDLGQRTMNDNRASGIWACRDIIDKYKAESGAQDADNN